MTIGMTNTRIYGSPLFFLFSTNYSGRLTAFSSYLLCALLVGSARLPLCYRYCYRLPLSDPVYRYRTTRTRIGIYGNPLFFGFFIFFFRELSR
jgi:hypothetical protein